MSWTLVASSAPTSGDAVYNILRLALEARGRDHEVRLFFINDAVDTVRDDFELDEIRELLDECIQAGVAVKICTTCVTRCGIGKGAVRSDVDMSAMADLADWIEDSDRVLTF